MGNGCRANPCLIGKGSTAESLNQDPDDAAIHGVIIEGTANDFSDRSGDFSRVGKKNGLGPSDINTHHDGDEFFGDFGNAFDAAY